MQCLCETYGCGRQVWGISSGGFSSDFSRLINLLSKHASRLLHDRHRALTCHGVGTNSIEQRKLIVIHIVADAIRADACPLIGINDMLKFGAERGLGRGMSLI